MDKIKKYISTTYASYWVLLLTLVFSGGFNEYASCIISVIISVLLIIKTIKSNHFTLYINITSISIAVISMFYLISCFYAIDHGMAFVGFLKFLPILMYTLLLMQEEKSKQHLIESLPYMILILGITSSSLAFIPLTRDIFTVSGRTAGFFQYPNTFALFLLVGELILLGKEKVKRQDMIFAAILMVLMLFTGSRAVFILAVVSNILIIFFKKGKKTKIILGAVIATLLIAVLALSPLLKDTEIFSRYFTISLSESTFVGRLLYYCDALPLILKHPFGLGYMGYYYVQQSIQTGVYSVMYIHNDFLQLLLDVGWLPCLLFVTAIIKSFFIKGISVRNRIILLTIVLHSLFDFNLQFISMFCILLLFLNYDKGEKIEIDKHRGGVIFTFITTGLLSLYFAVALALAHFGCNEAADSMYPGNTQNKVELLITQEDVEAQNNIADRIISQNKYVQIAYSAKAHYAYSQGNFESLINYKEEIFNIAPFSYDEYEEYCYMLIQGIQLYNQIGDEYSVKVCEQQLINTAEKLEKLDDRLSEFGRKIVDQPKTQLPDEILEYIEALERYK